MFWFRPKALRKLFHHPWKLTDFEPEPYPLDGTLGHAIERILCYVAQDARYTTRQIISSHLAGWNYAMLEYKLQKFSAAIPNADFSSQAHFLEEWKRSGYQSARVAESARLPEQVLTIRQALYELVTSAKRSLAYRLPLIAKLLRPIYRGSRGQKSH